MLSVSYGLNVRILLYCDPYLGLELPSVQRLDLTLALLLPRCAESGLSRCHHHRKELRPLRQFAFSKGQFSFNILVSLNKSAIYFSCLSSVNRAFELLKGFIRAFLADTHQLHSLQHNQIRVKNNRLNMSISSLLSAHVQKASLLAHRTA